MFKDENIATIYQSKIKIKQYSNIHFFFLICDVNFHYKKRKENEKIK